MRVYTPTPGNLSLGPFDRLMTGILVGILHSWVNDHLLVPQGNQWKFRSYIPVGPAYGKHQWYCVKVKSFKSRFPSHKKHEKYIYI